VPDLHPLPQGAPRIVVTITISPHPLSLSARVPCHCQPASPVTVSPRPLSLSACVLTYHALAHDGRHGSPEANIPHGMELLLPNAAGGYTRHSSSTTQQVWSCCRG
jgi:hypothetical protein